MVICLEQGADLHMAQLMPPCVYVYAIIQVVPEKRLLNGCFLFVQYVSKMIYFVSSGFKS